MIKVITGSMFSGKSLELIQNIETYLEYYNIDNILFFKPTLDKRDKDKIKSRDSKKEYESTLINNLNEIKSFCNSNTKLIIIDEAQFLKGDVEEILKLHYKGINFIISGLNLDSNQKPFGIMPNILSIATEIHVLKSECLFCGKPAFYTKTNEEKKEEIDTQIIYYPICKDCINDYERYEENK